jgi:SAM-dependent methyltransferase
VSYNPWVEAVAGDAIRLTGAQGFMDASDIREVLKSCYIELEGKIVEIGCGTGRLAQLCQEYVGYDISPEFVSLARSRGVDARLGLPDGIEHGDWLFIIHVFCHIPREEREKYLRLGVAPKLLVDIIPGPNEKFGNPAIYTVEPEEFEDDLLAAGWEIVASHERPSEEITRHDHHYYVCER